MKQMEAISKQVDHRLSFYAFSDDITSFQFLSLHYVSFGYPVVIILKEILTLYFKAKVIDMDTKQSERLGLFLTQNARGM